MSEEWEIYEQICYDGAFSHEDTQPPEGPGWEPFGVIGSVEHNGIRNSLGGGYEHRAVIYWRRKRGNYKTYEQGFEDGKAYISSQF